MSTTGSERKPVSEPAIVISRRTLRRVLVIGAAVLVLAGVGVGAFVAGRTTAPSRRLAGSPKTTTAPDLKSFYVPSTAMWPTIKGGDTVEVDLTAYAKSSPRLGDIVVFRRPPAEHCGGTPVTDLVKRVIGLPGQTVSARGGKVYITGKLLKEPWLPKGSQTYTAMSGTVHVPKDDYYVMGDNRVNSCDSRTWGPVKRSYIRGGWSRCSQQR